MIWDWLELMKGCGGKEVRSLRGVSWVEKASGVRLAGHASPFCDC